MADGICYYDWYFNDWLGSATRAEMTAEDRGIYRDLLDHQAAIGSLPKDETALANLAMCSTGQVHRFLERWADKCFPVGEDDRRRNVKMAVVREAILAALEKRSAAGKEGAKARWQPHSNRIAKAMPCAYGSGSGSGSELPLSWIPESIRTEEVLASVREWLAYKRERGKTYKQRGLAALLKKLGKHSVEQVIGAIEQAMASNWEGLFPEKINGRSHSNSNTGGNAGQGNSSAGTRRANKAIGEYEELGGIDDMPKL